jgi:hypothetical protein
MRGEATYNGLTWSKPMKIPIRFPHPADVIAEDAEGHRSMPIAEKLAQLCRLLVLRRSFPKYRSNSSCASNADDRLEVRWREAHREVFKRYGR